MRGRDRSDEPHDPHMAGALAALDAAVAGEPADPEYTELSELACRLVEDRPAPRVGELVALDRAVANRSDFPHRRAQRRPATTGGMARSRRWRLPQPLLGGAAAALATGALAAVVVALPGGGGGVSGTTSSASTSAASSSASASAPRAPEGTGAPARSSARSAESAGSAGSAGSATAGQSGSTSNNSGNFFEPFAGAGAPPTPAHAPGRQVVQGAQLALAAAPARIDQVAQEVFDVVGAESGIVNRSTVDSGTAASAYASFSLSIPSVNLPAALRLLSTLRGAQVLSRTDSTSDITGTVNGAGARLAEDRALRGGLLRQLAAATTDAEIASLQARLRAVDGRIGADTAKLNGLHHQVADSQVTVTIQPAAPAPAPVHHSAGFTLGRALHVAGRVLVVAGGVALIALAVAVPLGLAGGLVVWIWLAIRRRRREAALDLL